jgi:hypothetical protein
MTGARENGACVAYRLQLIAEVKYGQFGEYLKTWKKLDSIIRERGWVASRVLAPTAGPNNGFVAEFEYPDLATFETEYKAFYSDEEVFGAFRAGVPFLVQGTWRTELYEDVIDLPGSD